MARGLSKGLRVRFRGSGCKVQGLKALEGNGVLREHGMDRVEGSHECGHIDPPCIVLVIPGTVP